MTAHYYVETEDGRDWFATEAEARAAAADAVADIRMDLHGEPWPDAVEAISWGLELGRVVEVARGERPDTACRLCHGEIDNLGVCVDPLCREVTELTEWADYAPVPHEVTP